LKREDKMSVVSCTKIKKNDLVSAIDDSLDLIDFRFEGDIRNIVIKPNMCYYWDYSTGQTTDPRFVSALIDVLRQRISKNVRISIIESDASAMKCKHIFRFLGYEEMAKQQNVQLINLSEERSDPVSVEINGQNFRLMVPRIIQDADMRINATKIKYSLDTIKITCALKNIYGCNPYPKKFQYHYRLNEAIVALNKIMKFDLCLIDGGIVFGTHALKLGLVMASKDSVAIDSAAANIAGVNPNAIKYLRLAFEEGLGSLKYRVEGMPLAYFKQRFPRQTAKKKLMSKAFRLVLLLNLGKKLGLE
jgi:uncharacterized protein (DUF362 family)